MAGLFFCPGMGDAGGSIELVGDEAAHAVNVRRMRVGEAISITDGEGRVCDGKVAVIDKKPPRLQVDIDKCVTQPRGIPVHLAAALPKGERQRTMLDMAVQAGMDSYTPLACERSVSKSGKHAAERWQRITLEAMKQSRRAWLPEIHEEASVQELLASLPAATCLVVASATGSPPGRLDVPASASGIVILVGPEGGFTETESELIAAAGARGLQLGGAVLRTETAGVLAVAAMVSMLRT